jgi:hypothetical protein
MNAAERRRLYEQEVGADALQRQLRAAARKCDLCGRPMRFVVTGRGRRTYVDFDPHEDGTVLVDRNGRADTYRETPTTVTDGATLHFFHEATCPNK